MDDEGEGIRLQKVLAAAGLGSRRACEELIDAGRVEVDGKIVREQGMRVDPDTAIIKVDGSRLPTRSGMTYVVLNKPRGVVSTMSDPENRPCIGDYVQDRTERLFHVGRLDTDTEGLILFTNDGDLANRLTHPKYGVPKTYFADIPGPIPRDLGRTLKGGVELEDGLAKADKFRMIGQTGGRVQVEVEIHEGRNHIVRRMFDAVGHPVARLVRVQIGSVNMGNLAPGRLRHLTTHEVSALLTASEDVQPAPRTKPASSRRVAAKDAAKAAARKNVGAPAVRKAKAERNAATAAKKAGDRPSAPRSAARKSPADRTPASRSTVDRPAVSRSTSRGTTSRSSADRSSADRTSAPGKSASGSSAPRRSAPRRSEAGSGDDWRDGRSSRPASTKRSAPTNRAPAERGGPAKRSGPADRAAPAKRSAPADRGVPAKRSAPTERGAPAKRSAPAERGAPAKRSAPARGAAPAKRAAPEGRGAPAKRSAPAKGAAPARRATPETKRPRG